MQTRSPVPFLLALAALATAARAHAQDPPELPVVQVSTEPIPTEAWALPADAIDRAPAPSLSELLRQLPGVHLDRMGGRGAVSSLYLRGADPNFTAIYLDGVKVNDPTNTRGGSVDFSAIPADSIERIELLGGPASALLGADALAGAINIVTRRGTDARAGGRIAGGAYGLRRSAAQLGDEPGGFGYALRAGYSDSGAAMAGSSAILRSVGLNLDPGESLKLSLHHSAGELQAFPEDSGGPRHASRREREQRRSAATSGGLDWQRELAGGLDLTVRGAWLQREEDIASPGVAPGARDPLFGIPASTVSNRLRRSDARVALESGPWRGFSVRGGAQAGSEQGSSDGEVVLLGPVDFDLQRDSSAAFVDADWLAPLGPGDVLLEASVRADRHEDYDPLTRRVRASYRLGGTTLSAGWSEGFKLPSFYALGNPTVGNPDLEPEESDSREVAIAQAFGRSGLARLTLFTARYLNAVDFEEGPPPRLVNRDAMTSAGAEAALQWRPLEALHWQLALTHADTDLEGTDERLRNRPRWTGGTQATWRPPLGRARWATTVSAVYVGATLDSSIPTGDVRLADYTRVDGALDWQATRWLALRLAGENLLDADYEELVGFPGPRRAGWLEVRVGG